MMNNRNSHPQIVLQEELDEFADKRLNLLSKVRQGSVHQALSTLKMYSPLRGPYVVEIDPTTACNLACPECISGSLLNHGSLSTQKVLETLDQLAEMGTKAVIFIGGGEPMAHPQFSDLLRRAHDNGLQIGITTNGTLIDRHQDAIASCVAWTRVSIDAGRSETFRAFRPSHGDKHSLSSIIQQMERLARVKLGKLGYSFLLLRRGELSNLDELIEATTIARDIGCDYIEVKPSMNLDHSLVNWSEAETDLIMTRLQHCKSLETPTFSVLAPITLFKAMRSIENVDQPKDYHWCPATHYRTVLTPSGCYVCPYHRGNNAKKYGDLRADSFKDIWNSTEFRDVLQDTDPSRDCRFHCIRHGQNQHVMRLTTSKEDVFTSDEILEDFDPFI